MSDGKGSLPWRRLLGAVFALLAVVALVLRSLLGFGLTSAGADGVATPPNELWDALDSVMEAHVQADGTVDYTGLAANSEALRAVAAAIGVSGPRTTPGLYPTEDERLAYYINAYNVLTLLGVIAHWPIETVHDVRGAINPKDGFGFFYAQRFRLDGKRVSLYSLENDLIRGNFIDARFHAAINCASASCPRLARAAYRAESLDEALTDAAREFASRAPHVNVVPGTVELSQIYSWYAGDFEAHAGALGLRPSVLSWVDAHAGTQSAFALGGTDLSIRYVDYDWSLNGR